MLFELLVPTIPEVHLYLALPCGLALPIYGRNYKSLNSLQYVQYESHLD